MLVKHFRTAGSRVIQQSWVIKWMGQPEASAVYNHRHILIMKFKYRYFIVLYYHPDQCCPFQLQIKHIKQLHGNSMRDHLRLVPSLGEDKVLNFCYLSSVTKYSQAMAKVWQKQSVFFWGLWHKKVSLFSVYATYRRPKPSNFKIFSQATLKSFHGIKLFVKK